MHLNGARRFLRFSLRGLLAFVFVTGLVLLAGNYVLRAWNQHESVRLLVRLGAHVEYDDGSAGKDEDASWEALRFNLRHDVTCVIFRGFWQLPDGTLSNPDSDPTREHLELVAAFGRLKTLGLEGCEVGDDDLKTFASLPLETLNLTFTPISDAGLRHVAQIGTLRELVLRSGRRYSMMESWGHVGSPLPEHRVQGPTITDAGVEHLGKLQALERLDLSHSSISDKSIEHLKRLPKVRRLWIGRTNISETGVAMLKKANPNLEVFRGVQ